MDTMDMNNDKKFNNAIGKEQERYKEQERKTDRVEISTVMKVMSEITEGASEKDIEKFYLIVRHESNKNNPITISFQRANILEDVDC